MRVRLERRLETPRWISLAIPLVSLLLAFLTVGLAFTLSGVDPATAYVKMFAASFGSWRGLSEIITKSIPLMLCGLCAAIAFKASIWNIGGEGQLLMGSFAATWIALYILPASPSTLVIPAMYAAGFLFGALWGLIPALLKVKLEVNEVITTLMLNYVAELWIVFLVYGPWRGPSEYGFPYTSTFPLQARLPTVTSTRIHVYTLIISLAACFLLHFLLTRTKLGFEVKVTGESLSAARYAGMSYLKVVAAAMIISGGLAGLAGVGEVAGIHHRLRKGVSTGYGYSGIIVAWLAKLNPILVLPASILMGGLLVSVDVIQVALGLPAALAYVFQGLVLFFLLGGDVFTRYKLVLRRR